MNDFQLNDYVLINQIGFGAFGKVYRVQNKNDDQYYAAKISTKCFNIEDKDDKDFIKNFKREVSIISKVHHPSILKFIGFSMTDFDNTDKPVIVTNFLPYGSLQDILNQSHHACPPKQWNETLQLINIYGIASAMAFLHEHKIIHRDLKPDNILMDQYYFPIIADFGLSKDESIESSTIDIKGTPAYIAPEIWEDQEYSQKSDVYAFAYIVYEIYANEKPFSGLKNLTMYKFQKNICNGHRPDTSFIQTPYRQLIEACWSADPFERPTFKEIVESLKNDKRYINDLINEDDFNQYIQYIDKNPKIFDDDVEILDYFKFDVSKTKTIKAIETKKSMIYPANEFKLLSKSCQKIVMEAEEDPDKQYKVGYNLINEKKKFPENIELGIKYLEKAIKAGSIKAVILYNKLLIDGEKIKEDLKQAENNLKKHNNLQDSNIILLQAMIEKKKGNFRRAFKLLNQSIKKENDDAKFEYWKMTYQGAGTDENKRIAKKYLNDIIDDYEDKIQKIKQECKKSLYKSTMISKYEKNLDIVFLIDGTKTNTFFIQSIKEVFDSFAEECHSKYPDIYFRYGVVVYYDYIFFKKALPKCNWAKPDVIDFTDSPDDVSIFLNDIDIKGGGPKLANDWAIGYKAINEMSWNENAEKIVIHACNCPAHGQGYTIPKNMHKKYFRIPCFNKNFDFKRNREIYIDLQEKQRRNIYYCIRKLANDGIKLFCLNGNENSVFCFQKVNKAYTKNHGSKFIVKDLFGFTFEDDCDDDSDTSNEKLNKKLKKFATNAISTCVNGNKAFENECKQQFQKDYDQFMAKNDHKYRSSETTETDFEDDEQDDDDFDLSPLKKDKKKKHFLHHKRVIVFDVTDDDDDDKDDDDKDDDDKDGDDDDDKDGDDDDDKDGDDKDDDDDTDDDDNDADNDFNKARYKHVK